MESPTKTTAVELQTERLLIVPLTLTQLRLYTPPDGAFEKSFGLNAPPRILPDELNEAIENTLLPAAAAAGENGLFCTLWAMIDRKARTLVGDLCFKGDPAENGEVEIGYGTYGAYQTAAA